jgi:hypothetical protein
MTTVLTYVEIDVPAWTQSSPDSPETEFTLRFAINTLYLPNSIPAIPSITDINIEPATVSLGEDLGQRASITVTFRDHRHVFDGEDFDSGTFWGKFRARYGLTLQGNPLRLIRGALGQELEDMETRHWIIDSTTGPNADGMYQIIAKDILTFATGMRAQAPMLSTGVLIGNITSSDGTLTLSPSGIGSEYPASGHVAIGGKEIVSFTRVSDVLTITRAQFNTIAQAHTAGDRVQLCLRYQVDDPADIINDLFTTYADIDADFIPLAAWQAETAAYLGTNYSALIADPKPVDQLVAELIEQAALALWWDDVTQTIRLQVLRPISTTAATYDQSNTLRSSLEVEEQPERRLSEVQVYYGKINPLVQDDEIDNYRNTKLVEDELAVDEYGSSAIKVIKSRWIPTGSVTVAETLANKLLGRFRDPPRLVKFEIMRDQPIDPMLGGGHQLGGTPFQTITGAADAIPIQITRLNPSADRFLIEAQEMLWTPFGGDIDPGTRTITFDANINDVNLRNIHDDIYPEPESGDVINVIIQAGVTIGSTGAPLQSADSPEVVAVCAFFVGSWPTGVTINITVNGRIQGKGGLGGGGGSANAANETVIYGDHGVAGGTALYTRRAINLTSTNGEIWGGGGGGGGGSGIVVQPNLSAIGGGGGGGGAGTVVGNPAAGGVGSGGSNQINGGTGNAGTASACGAGGSSYANYANGGAGGGPGLAGVTGGTTVSAGIVSSSGGSGGNAGNAIDGDSFVTDVGAVGDIRGGQIN